MNTIDECRSKYIVKNIVFVCHFSATNGNRKHSFKRFLIRVRRLLKAFSKAAYPEGVDRGGGAGVRG